MEKVNISTEYKTDGIKLHTKLLSQHNLFMLYCGVWTGALIF